MPSRMTYPFSRRIMLVFVVILVLLPLAVQAQTPTVPVKVTVIFPGQQTGGAAINTPIQSSTRTSTLVFEQVARPAVQTSSEKAAEAQEKSATSGPQLRRRPLTAGGYGRYERVEFDTPGAVLDLDGNIYSLNAQLAWDMDDFSFGALIPYDFLDLDSLDAHRIGAIAFGQYHWPVSTLAALHLTVNGAYTYTAIDGGGLSDINTFGGGASVSLSVDKGLFVGSGTLAYQFTADDSDNVNDHQHLLKLGLTAGVRAGRNAAITLFSTWTTDVTDYSASLTGIDTDYFDLGLELSWSLSSTWRLTGGYKKVLGLENFDSNQVFLGTLLRF